MRRGTKHSLETLVAHTDANLKGTIAPPKSSAATPVDGEIHADYSADHETTLTGAHVAALASRQP